MDYNEQAALNALLYASIFKYPLTQEELWQYAISPQPLSKKSFFRTITTSKRISQLGKYYFLPGKDSFVDVRLRREHNAKDKLRTAKFISRILALIPSISFIGISGSLSMLNTEIEDDIDFCIFAENNTVWITRLLILLILQLLGKRRKKGESKAKNKICINLLLEASRLDMFGTQKNLYTAHEIVQLKPLMNRKHSYERFLSANDWVKTYMPNAIVVTKVQNKDEKQTNSITLLLHYAISLLNFLAMRLQLWYMKRKTLSKTISDNALMFYPSKTGERVLDLYNKQLRAFASSKQKYMYNIVVCGGTFDHFHKGHAAFLQEALRLSRKVLVGITTDAYSTNHKALQDSIQPYDERRQAVEDFLVQIQAKDRVTVAPIDSVLYPPEWEELPIEAIVVTEETKRGADIINTDRRQKGLAALAVETVPLVADDTGGKIAATKIREGKINREGTSYVQPSWFSEDLILPDIERKWFREPFGTLYTNTDFLQKENPEQLVSVGDVVTGDCNRLSFHQKLSVVDFTVQRKPTFHDIRQLGFLGIEHLLKVKNPPGHITTELVQTLTNTIARFSASEAAEQFVIVVDGEEDLAVIPLVLLLPLGFTIVYGQPDRGIVRLPVTPEAKEIAYSLIKRLIVASN